MIIHRASGHFKEKNGNEYLVCASTDKNKKLLAKYADFRNKIKYLIKTINGEKEIDNGKDLMRIKIDTDDELPLNKLVNFPTMAVIIRFVFEEDKYYPKFFFRWMFVWVIKLLLYKRIDVSEEIDPNKTSASRECMLCYNGYFKDVAYIFESNMCSKFLDVLMTAYELKITAILNVKGFDYRCVFWSISSNEDVNILYSSVSEYKGCIIDGI